MNCDETQELLSALHDGELETNAARAATDHVAGCNACTKSLASLQSLRQLIQRQGRSPVPGRLLDRIEAAATRATVTQAAGTNHGLARWILPRLAAAGLGALCVGGALWLSRADVASARLAPSERVANYLQTSPISVTLDELRQLRRRPESRVLAWARQEAKRR